VVIFVLSFYDARQIIPVLLAFRLLIWRWALSGHQKFGAGITETEVNRLEENARLYIREQTGMNRSLIEH